MISKILFTLLVIAGALGFARYRATRNARIPVVRLEPPPQPANPWPRRFAYLLSVVLLGGAGVYFFFMWQDQQRIMTIRVINPKSGETTVYQAHKGEIRGRGFVTLDGWSIKVSDAERVEINEAH